MATANWIMKQKWRYIFLFFTQKKLVGGKTSHKTILLCPFDRYFFRKKHTNLYVSSDLVYGECIVCVVTRNTFMYRPCASLCQYKYNNEWHNATEDLTNFFILPKRRINTGALYPTVCNTEHAFGAFI